jgi:Fe-S cluster assembly iron-binding protein IscA
MLQVTTAAVTALEEARAAQQVPDDHGVRVSAQPDPNDAANTVLALGFTEAPIEGDQVTDQAGTEIYIAAEVAEPLASTVLDIEDTPQGAQLILKPQEGDAEAATEEQ